MTMALDLKQKIRKHLVKPKNGIELLDIEEKTLNKITEKIEEGESVTLEIEVDPENTNIMR